MASDIVERLQKQAAYLEAAYGWTGDIEEAASLITTLTAERDALAKKVGQLHDYANMRDWQLVTAEGLLDAVGDALKPLARLETPHLKNGGNAGAYSIRFEDIGRARTAFAQITARAALSRSEV